MRPESLQTLAQVIACVGILLTVLGGYGAHYFEREIARAQADAATQREEGIRAEGQRSLAASADMKSQLEPFEKLAGEMHPDLAREPALAKLREDVEGLKTRLSPRLLSAPQQETILVALRKYAPREIDITAVKGDPEAWQFAEQLKSAIEAGGWTVASLAPGDFSVPIRGIFVSVRQTPAPPAAGELVGALEAAGIVPNGNIDPRQRSERVNLVVATKD